jgi:hypothetical protein
MWEWLFGKRVTPSEHIAEQVKRLQVIERTFQRDAKKAEKAVAEYTIQADNLLLAEEKKGGTVETIQSKYIGLLMLAEKQERRVTAYRAMAQKAIDLATQVKTQAGSVEMLKASAEAAIGMIRMGQRYNPGFLQHITMEYAKTSNSRLLLQETLNEAIQSTTESDIGAEDDVFNEDAIRAKVGAQVNAVRIKEGLEMDRELEDLPSVAIKKETLKKARVLLQEEESKAALVKAQQEAEAEAKKKNKKGNGGGQGGGEDAPNISLNNNV